MVIFLAGAANASAWYVSSPRTVKSVATSESTPAASPVDLTTTADLEWFLPTGAVVMVRYHGGEALGPAFQQSAIGQILNDPQMKQFLQKPKQAVYRAVTVATNALRKAKLLCLRSVSCRITLCVNGHINQLRNIFR